ncbi:MAG: AIR synthase family protein [Caldisphaera sp.]|jgi:hydrogenase maturation factor|nr:AIR synthase family protein [Caldisphaera sp.]PMP60283.1 MAG: hydrogenase assembly protein HupF [Caldisphaera sp.]PMP88688.1 MAG: hydrogenase assembly protein HupF [Caldisphaera sp.]
MVIKLPHDDMMKYVLSRIGKEDTQVIVGPRIGEDASIIDIGDGKVLVSHVDPIVGAIESIGWLSVNIVSNDIAVRGVRPRWLLSDILLPEGSGNELLDKVTLQIDSAAKEIGVMVVGGHTAFAPKLNRVIVSMTAIGIGEKDKVVRTSNAKEGDEIIMTKTAGVEGTAILATDFKKVLLKKGVSEDVLRRGREFLKFISIMREALVLSDAGLANSMHDATNGGVLEGIAEMAYASKKTIEVFEDRVPIADETVIMANALGIDSLKLISSGVLIASVPNRRSEKAIELLKSIGVKASVIGRVWKFSGDYVLLHRKRCGVERIKDVYVQDELDSLWEVYGKEASEDT